MKTILLTQNKVTVVDDEDFEELNSVRWAAVKRGKTFYAARRVKKETGSYTTQYMHALIMKTPKGDETRHINGEGLDNRRSNLQIVSRSTHKKMTPGAQSNSKSGYRGVFFRKDRGWWKCELWHEGRGYTIEPFDTAEKAAHARDAQARSFGWPEEGMNFPNI